MKEPLVSFGTDGLRGRVPEELDFADAIAFGYTIATKWQTGTVIGFDSRQSSPQLAEGIRLGFLAAQKKAPASCLWLGVAPTPAVAHLAKSRGSTGVVVTASHNPHPDNGLKVFDPTGLKPSQAVEDELSRIITKAHTSGLVEAIVSQQRPAELAPHSAVPLYAVSLYVDAVCDSLPEGSLRGVKVVADCANGAMSVVVPEALRRLGADFTLLNASPDGMNINQNCGSTAPHQMSATTKQLGADFGFALDGDGDRVIAAMPDGSLLDGDDMLAILTSSYLQAKKLVDKKVVITPMANLGLRLKLKDWGVAMVEVPVGDRNVQHKLLQGGWVLGGEQSGHIIMPQHAHTGDGLLTALHVLDVIWRNQEIWPVFEKVPQILINLETNLEPQEIAQRMTPEMELWQQEDNYEMRVLVRASGTERVLRIMVEAQSQDLLDDISKELVALAQSLDK